MNVRELEAFFRVQIDDKATPPLWTHDDFLIYLNDAINDACERAFLIEDNSTPEVVRIAVKATKHTYDLDPSVIRIERARLDLATSTLKIVDRTTLDNESNWDALTGTPTRVIDQGTSIRLVRIPTVADTLRLVVKRRPLCALKDDSDIPEIPAGYHVRLIDGVMARAYLKRDVDSYNPNLSDRSEADFTRWFGQRRDANVMRKHREQRTHTTRCNW